MPTFLEGVDFDCQRQTVTLSSRNTQAFISFDITDDPITEGNEFFTTSISTDAERVEVSVPNAQVNIRDNDSQLNHQQHMQHNVYSCDVIYPSGRNWVSGVNIYSE